MEGNEHNLEPDSLISKIGPCDPKLDLAAYKYPPIDLLPESIKSEARLALNASEGFVMPLWLNGTGQPVLQELYHRPNVLLAGTIASGKTQFVCNQLLLWLHCKRPEEIKFVICRSKPVDYNSLVTIERHFLAKLPGEISAFAEGNLVITNTLNGLAIECSARLDLFRKADVKNIQDYNTKFVHRQLNPVEGHRYLPDMVLVVDDLSTCLTSDTLPLLVRITQQNLYTGIYVIAVTSQIMARAVSPQLKANFSVRLAMKLMSQNESRKILERVGAEKLLNPGDLLYEAGDKLLKGTQLFIDCYAIIETADFIGSQPGYPSAMPLPGYTDEHPYLNDNLDLANRDPMFEDAARLMVLHQQGSTSLIQRKLKLGYNRAGRIMDQLEAAGIVGAFEGRANREVLFPDEYLLEQYLEMFNKETGTTPVTRRTPRIRLSSKKPLRKTKKIIPPPDLSSMNKPNTSILIWVALLVIIAIIYLVGGCDAVVDWVTS